MIKISKYTVIDNIDNGILIYNLKNGAQIFIDEASYMEEINHIRDGNFDEVKNEIFFKLFCIDSDINEAQEVITSYYRNYFNPSHLSFIIMPNNTCNFNCVYCYQRHDARHISNKTVDDFLKAIKAYYYKNGIKSFYIEWFGGEPLLSYDVISKITLELNSFFVDKDVNVHYGMTTNGYMLTADKCDFLLKNKFDYFQITLDGGPSTHNKTRLRLDGEPTWDVIFNNLVLMKERYEQNFDIIIRVNYNYETFNSIKELLDYISEKLDKRFSIFFHGINKWGGENDENLDIIESSLEPFMLLMLIEEAVKHGIEPKTNFRHFNPFGKVCYAGMPYHFTLGTDGKLRKCNEEDEIIDCFNVIGTVENGTIEFHDERWSKFVLPGGEMQIQTKCLECIFLPICFGQQCPKNRIRLGELRCPNDMAITNEIMKYKYRYFKNLTRCK